VSRNECICPYIRGAGNRVRTDDLLITNQLLYQLSYAGIYEGKLLSFTALSRRIVYAICIRWHKTMTKCAIPVPVPQGATVRVAEVLVGGEGHPGEDLCE
jgi:hypothetical protein